MTETTAAADYTTHDARRILAAQARTAHTLRIARARSVLKHADVRKQSRLWALVALDTIDETVAAAEADVEARVMLLAHGDSNGEPR